MQAGALLHLKSNSDLGRMNEKGVISPTLFSETPGLKKAYFPAPALALSFAYFLLPATPANASFIIVPTWATNITSDANAATIEATINAAIAIYQSKITDNVTVNITFQETSSGLGSSSTNVYGIGYSSYINALFSHSNGVDDTAALLTLNRSATVDPVDSQSSIFLKGPLARALGVGTFSANHATMDGTISLNTSQMNLSRTGMQDAAHYDLQSVVSHEIDEVLGLGSSLGQSLSYSMPEDLFRYASTSGGTCSGVSGRSYTTSTSAKSCFSINGSTSLVQFNNTGSGDYGDWLTPVNSANARVQDANGTAGTQPNLSVEWRALDVIGYTLAATATPEPATWLVGLPLLVAGLVSRSRFAPKQRIPEE